MYKQAMLTKGSSFSECDGARRKKPHRECMCVCVCTEDFKIKFHVSSKAVELKSGH